MMWASAERKRNSQSFILDVEREEMQELSLSWDDTRLLEAESEGWWTDACSPEPASMRDVNLSKKEGGQSLILLAVPHDDQIF